MDTLQTSGILSVVFFYANLRTADTSQCIPLSENPCFDEKQVLGKSWRIYHTWNMKMENKCFDMTFKNATTEMIDRIYHDMYDYVEYQPDWYAATLLVIMGSVDHEMLLIADGKKGNFVGVPNLARDGNQVPEREKHTSINRVFLKLLHDGAYLLMADCNIGVTTLSAQKKPENRSEVESVVSSLPLDKGDSACTIDKAQYDQIFP